MLDNIKPKNEIWNEYINNYNNLIKQMELKGLDINLLNNLISSIHEYNESSKNIC